MNFWIPIVINCLWYYVFKKISSSSSSSSVGTRLIIECMWFRETLRMPGKRTSFLVYLQSKIIQYVHSMGSIISLFHMLCQQHNWEFIHRILQYMRWRGDHDTFCIQRLYYSQIKTDFNAYYCRNNERNEIIGSFPKCASRLL
jgi:hypothetical protein